MKKAIYKILGMLLSLASSRFLATEVDGKFIDDALKKTIPNYGTKVTRPLALDSKYYTVTSVEFAHMKRIDLVDKAIYLANRFDCDDFAITSKSMMALLFGVNSVGIVIDNVGHHAYNLVVFSDGYVKFYEPQTDEEIDIATHPKYNLTEGLIIL